MVTTTTGIATSFIQFSRASLATVTNNVGNIAWAGHNLLTNSESFDAAVWQATGMNAFGSGSVANATSAPNGTSTADLCVPANVNSTHTIWQPALSSVNGVPYTTVLFVKPNGYTKLALVENQLTGYYVSYDATGSGTVLTESNATGTITPLSDGWYRITHVSAAGGTLYRPQIFFLPASYTTGTYISSWTPNGTSGMYLWGAHLYRSDLGGMVYNPAQPAGFGTYYPTTPKNSVGYSEDLINAAWAKIGTSVLSNISIAPNGLQTADKLVALVGSGGHSTYYSGSVAFSSATQTVSFYAKAAEYSLVQVFDGANGQFYVSFNLATGAVVAGSSGGARYVSSAITSVGSDGWYRCSMVVSGIVLTAALSFNGYPAGATLGAYGASFTGDGSSGLYLWGIQVSDSASIEPYSPVYGAAVTSSAYYAPRLDYSPTTIQPLGMLVEEQRTNLVLQSAAFNTSWTAQQVSVTANISSVNAPDGTTTSDQITSSVGAAIRIIGQTFTLSAVSHTFSVWVKAAAAGNRKFRLVANQDLGSAVGTASSVFEATDQWQRFTFTATGGTGYWGITQATSPDFDFDLLVWGAQLEAGSFATSYIPTGASTVTRSADAASVSAQAFPYSQPEGTLVFNFGAMNFANSMSGEWPYDATIGIVTNGVRFGRQFTAANANSWYVSTKTGTPPASSAISGSAAFAPYNGPVAAHKLGIGISATDMAGVVNGGTVTTTAFSSAPTGAANLLYINQYINGHIRQITYLPRRISNTELQTRTT